MNPNSHPLCTLQHSPSSGISESDSLSDSDWLDIASNRESDDNDSVLSGDSDGEDNVMVPLSRRSSISAGSSRDGEVDAWEGFAYESGDEEIERAQLAMTMPLLTAAVIAPPVVASEATVGSSNDLFEEQRVNEALDQSMMSTLGASRSSTASTHTSLRDLRLSFPDPLTSSKDELSRSYEDVPTSDVTGDRTDTPTVDDESIEELASSVDSPPCEEHTASFVAAPDVTTQIVDEDKVMFDVVLYGPSSPIKWSFPVSLMEQAALSSGFQLINNATGSDQAIRYLQLHDKFDDSLSSVVQVLDRTDNANANDPSYQALIKPSLAIVYLPSTVHAPPYHTLYLPVLVPSSSREDSSLSRSIATRNWEAMSIPSDKVMRLTFDTNPIINGSDGKAIRDVRAYQLLQRLLSASRKRPIRAISDHISPAQAVTLFALMSLLVGFAMNTTFRKSTTPSPTTPSSSSVSTFWGIFGPEMNQTAVIATSARVNVPIMTHPKESSLSIINPGTTSLVITTDNKPREASASSTPVVAGFHCRPSTWVDKVKSVKDIAVGAQTQTSAEAGPSTTQVSKADAPPVRAGSKSTALGFVVETLSDALDVRVTQIRKDYRVDEVVESLDELARAIRRQTILKVDKGKGKAKEIRDNVQYRHERARGRAKELKRKGEEIIYLASGEFVERTNMARKKARDILKKKGEEFSYIASGEFMERTNQAKRQACDLLKKTGEEIFYLASGEFVERTNTAKKKASDLWKTGEEIIHLAGGATLIERTNIAKKKARDITLNLANSESWRTYRKAHADWVALLKEKSEDNHGLGKGKGRTCTGASGGRKKRSGDSPSGLLSLSLADYYVL